MPNVTTLLTTSRSSVWRSRIARARLPGSRLQQQRAARGHEAQGPVADLLRPEDPRRRCRSASRSRNGTPATTSCSTRRSICSTTRSTSPRWLWSRLSSSMQEILNNEGEKQLMDVFDSYISAAEKALGRRHGRRRSTATARANGGKQITGLATAIPIVPTHRHLWRHRSQPQHDLAHADIRRAYRPWRARRRSTRPRSGRCSTAS